MADDVPVSPPVSRQQIGLFSGPVVFAPFDVFPSANAALASTLWIATWWVTEAIPATSLLPIVLFPLTGVVDVAGEHDEPTPGYFCANRRLASSTTETRGCGEAIPELPPQHGEDEQENDSDE